MPAPYRVAVLIAAWRGLRFGEVAELRRKDIELDDGRLLWVRRAVTYVDGTDIARLEVERRHPLRGYPAAPGPRHPLRRPAHTAPGRDGLLFRSASGRHLHSGSAMHDAFHVARAKVGRPDLTFHDLRHTGATLAAATGATLAELMARLGHSTPAAAMLYQHASVDRDQAIAAALSEFHLANVVDLRAATKKAR